MKDVNYQLKLADTSLRTLERFSPQFEVVFQNEAVAAMRAMYSVLKQLVEDVEELNKQAE